MGDGVNTKKVLQAARAKKHYIKNREVIIARSTQWNQDHKERHNELTREWGNRHKAYRLEQGQKWRMKNPDKMLGSRIKRLYGLSLDLYYEKLASQESCCAICNRGYLTLDVDHCHDTGKVRGLLCRQCDWLLGQAGNSVCILQNAVAYLQYHHWEED